MAQPSTSTAKKSPNQENIVLSPKEDEKILLRAFKEASAKGLSDKDRMKLFQEMRAEVIKDKLINETKIVSDKIKSLGGVAEQSELDALKIPDSKDIMGTIELPKISLPIQSAETAETKIEESRSQKNVRAGKQIEDVVTSSVGAKQNNSVDSEKTEQSLNEVKSETKISVVSEKNIKISLNGNYPGHYRGIDADVKLSSDGSVKVFEKRIGGESKDLSENFTTLYLGDDNKLRDTEGNIVSKIGSGTGKLASSYLPNIIASRSAANNTILEIAGNNLNNFSHENKQVIFVKGNPPEKIANKKSPESKISEVKNSEVKIQETKLQEQKAQTNDNTSVREKNSQVTETDRKIHPYKTHIYDVKINGRWTQQKAYLRINNTAGDNKLEIFTGRDSEGKDVWIDAKKVNSPQFTVVNIDKGSGNFTKEDGSKIDRFQKLDGTSLSSEVVKGLVEKSSTGLKGVQKSHINDLFIDGKRPIFF